MGPWEQGGVAQESRTQPSPESNVWDPPWVPGADMLLALWEPAFWATSLGPGKVGAQASV